MHLQIYYVQVAILSKYKIKLSCKFLFFCSKPLHNYVNDPLATPYFH